jgi:hypothetical protein
MAEESGISKGNQKKYEFTILSIRNRAMPFLMACMM